MDRQNIIIGVVAVVVLVALGAFFLWPQGADQAAVVTPETEVTGESGSGESAASDEQSGGY